MAVYRQVHVSFWQDPKVIEEMTPEDKYFYLYLLTNPSTTQIGVYSITKKQMAFDMGYSIDVNDTGTRKRRRKKEKQEKEQLKETKCPGKPKEVLSSFDEITSFVESQMASNPLPVNLKIVVKYIDTLRLYRKTGRISANIIRKLWDKWKNYHSDVVSYSMWIHVEKHDDKPEEYTLGIKRFDG